MKMGEMRRSKMSETTMSVVLCPLFSKHLRIRDLLFVLNRRRGTKYRIERRMMRNRGEIINLPWSWCNSPVIDTVSWQGITL